MHAYCKAVGETAKPNCGVLTRPELCNDADLCIYKIEKAYSFNCPLYKCTRSLTRATTTPASSTTALPLSTNILAVPSYPDEIYCPSRNCKLFYRSPTDEGFCTVFNLTGCDYCRKFCPTVVLALDACPFFECTSHTDTDKEAQIVGLSGKHYL